MFVHDAVTAWRVGNNADNDTLMSSFTPLTEEYLAWAVRPADEALHRDLQTGPKDCLPQCENKRLCRLGVTPSISIPGSHMLEAPFCLYAA